MASKIFEKQALLKPSAMATVAERRFGDAESLLNTKQNARANGAAYLAGFVIEILLKARLVRKYPATARKRQAQVSSAETKIWRLIWKQHDLGGMLDCMPELENALDERGDRDGIKYVLLLKEICGSWSIQARYSSHSMTMKEANEILQWVRALKEVLK